MSKKADQAAKDLPTEFPPKPRRPEDYECCGRHCEPCIFDYYNRAVERWEKKVSVIKGEN